MIEHKGSETEDVVNIPQVDVDHPDVPLVLYIDRDCAVLYRVWSGEGSMHKRGYKEGVIHKAALRDTTAAFLFVKKSFILLLPPPLL